MRAEILASFCIWLLIPQVRATNIILGPDYKSYQTALKTLQLDSLAARRETLCLKFGKKAIKHEKHSNWFKVNQSDRVTRQPRNKFCPVIARTKRFQESPISFLTQLLNEYYMTRKLPKEV